MYLGRVVGCVWATVKDPSLEGQRMLVIQPLTPDLRDTGKRLICLDTTGPARARPSTGCAARRPAFRSFPKSPPWIPP